MIRIKSQRDGFMRAGVAHPSEWTEYPDDTFSSVQLEALLAEPMLQVEVVEQAQSISKRKASAS